MTVNADVVDVYTVLAKKVKTSRKTQKSNNQKTQRILNINMSAKGGPIFTFSLPEGRLAPLPPAVTPLTISQEKNVSFQLIVISPDSP